MEMEAGCLLGLPIEGVEMLSVVGLADKCAPTSAPHTSDDVSQILLGTCTADDGSTNASCITSSMDFEFTNTDLSGPDFTLEHTSMFDISESVIDDKVELFRDSGIFDESIIKRNSDQAEANSKKLNLYKDLGLKLQIIPLNNLQLISTVETSEGLHILAVPADTKFCETSLTANLINSFMRPPVSLDAAGHADRDSGEEDLSRKITITNLSQPGPSSMMSALSLSSLASHALPFKNVLIGENSDLDQFEEINEMPKDEAINEKEFLSVNSTSNLIHQESTDQKQMPPINFLQKTHEQFDYQSDYLVQTQVNSKRNTTTPCSHSDSVFEGRTAYQKEKLGAQEHILRAKKFDGRKIADDRKIIIDIGGLESKRATNMISLLDNPLTNKLMKMKTKKQLVNFQANEKMSSMKVIFKIKSKRKPNLKSNICAFNCNEKIEDSAEMLPMCKDMVKSVPTESEGKPSVAMETINSLNSEHYGEIESQFKPKELKKKKEPDAVKMISAKKDTLEKDAKTVYTCDVCKVNFSRKGNYKNHLKVHRDIANKAEMKDFGQKLNSKSFEPSTDLPLESSAPVSTSDSQAPEVSESINIGTSPNIHSKETLLQLDYSDTAMDICPAEPETRQSSTPVLVSSETATSSGNHDNILTIKTETPRLTCKICQMKFSSEGNLTRHGLSHTVPSKEASRFKCEHCERTFLQRCDWQRHMHTHTGQFPHMCSICHKGFIRKSDLAVHWRFHMREKTFKCDLCSKAYYQSGDLNRHVRAAHKESIKLTCPHCPLVFKDKKSLHCHTDQMHGRSNSV